LTTDHNSTFSLTEALESRWLAVLDALPDLMFELDGEGRYLDYHSPRSDLLAMPAEFFLGKTLHEVLQPDVADNCMVALNEARIQGFSQGHQIKLTLPTGVSWFELSISRKNNGPDNPASFIVLSRDVTHRINAEHKLKRMTQLYAGLSQCNQAIVRCRSEAELFPIICLDAVKHGGMKMAWIGKSDATGLYILPVAVAGNGTGYLAGIVIAKDANLPRGRGPSGTAWREDRPFWCQDFLNDPRTEPWHEHAKQYGWGSSAALPLHCKGQVSGVLTVYASEPYAFDEAAQSLFLEMTADISFALDHFADEQERTQVQAALRDSEDRYRRAFDTSPDAININRLSDGLYLDVNSGFERITGWKHDEVVGKSSADIGIWNDPGDRQKLIVALKQEGQCINMEADFKLKDGSICHGLMSAVMMRFKDEDCILSITRDMTEKKRSEARIEQLAHFDQLTGLPNRNQLRERFEFILNLAKRQGDTLALMFLDLDHFKNINDSLGHSVGDRLLVEVSRKMASTLRAQDMLARMGGDEFILLLPSVSAEGAGQVALKLILGLTDLFKFDHFELVCTVSIGIAMYPLDGQDFETLSKNADTAMYRVKQNNRNNFCFFTQEMQANSARTLQLVNAMHHALERGEFELYYQPQIRLRDGRLVGAEALIRWKQPELGVISPGEFIPVAEDSGQILAIGDWVLRTAVTQQKRWLDAGLPSMVMAVNLSAVQFRHPHLLDRVTQILDEAALPAQYLELELTEATAMDDPVAAIALMNQLHDRGVRMSIDDFGTGYSSLSYLKKFNISKLKIDQSFVRDICDDPDDKAIVTAVINLASSLGLQTIAEGVETASQLAFLRLQGCDEVQGYYFSKPLPAAQFEDFARQQLGE
jgi:diguanylate cyclase (GGDEF)-like protein/PAS domain S-box-containing protein